MMNRDLQSYLENHILPQYAEYEASHGVEHIRTVTKNALELCDGLDVDRNMVMTIAAYHDIGLRYGREDHEITGARVLAEDRELDRWFSPEQIRTMQEAVEDHRASRKEKPRSIYGCIIAEADRDITPERILKRCILFEKTAHPEADEEEIIGHVLSHIEEKYGKNGYLKLWMPCKHNEEGLQTLRQWLATGELKKRVKSAL